MEWLGFLSNPDFMPHGHCYLWRPDILWTHIVADITIATAYFAIPVVLAIFLYKRKAAIPYAEILGLFIAFILLCGMTHLMNIYVTWYASYEIQGWLKALTAIVSILTALVLAPKLPELITLPGLKHDYEKNLAALETLEEKQRLSEGLLQHSLNREERILELKNEVNALLKAAGQKEKYLSPAGGKTSG